jgi:hypothetical protein
VGDTLVFTVGGGAAGGFLGAYAERPDTAPTAVAGRIWYFPTASGASPRVDRQAGAATTALGRGIQIGAEHGAGRYRVVAWISSRPLARAEAREPPKPDGRLILQHASLDLTIVGGP